MQINKKLKIFLIGLSLSFSINAISQQEKVVNNSQFLKNYQNIVEKIINEYDNSDLDARIFDINEKHFFDFLTNSTHYKKPGETDIMGMQYYSNFKVRGKSTAFCFILYDSKSKLIENYLAGSDFTIDEITEYLALHEMGHCLVMDYLNKNGKPVNNNRQNEGFADKFAIYLLNETNKQDIIKKILHQNSMQPQENIHHNYDELKKFYSDIQENKSNFSNFKTLIEYIISE